MNNITDFDIKKAFTFIHYNQLPPILIDEYWNHYMKIFNIENEYLEFSENIKWMDLRIIMILKINLMILYRNVLNYF